MQLLEDEPELAEKLGEVPVAVIEKGQVTGAHLLSGANMRPSAMEELFPDLDRSEWPVYQEVTKDAVYLLTKRNAIPLKPPPPNFRNHGNYVTSIAKLGRFLGEKAEEAGAYLLTETAADKAQIHAFSHAGHGPIPMIPGSTPAAAQVRMRASGRRPRDLAASALIIAAHFLCISAISSLVSGLPFGHMAIPPFSRLCSCTGLFFMSAPITDLHISCMDFSSMSFIECI